MHQLRASRHPNATAAPAAPLRSSTPMTIAGTATLASQPGVVARVSSPLVRRLSKLSVGKKLLLIYLLDLSTVIFISSILIHEKYIAIDFSRKELAGTA